MQFLTHFRFGLIFVSGIKTFYWLSNFGLLLSIGGEIIRKAAMLTAQSNFNHLVSDVDFLTRVIFKIYFY